jgi:hypothetical protein
MKPPTTKLPTTPISRVTGKTARPSAERAPGKRWRGAGAWKGALTVVTLKVAALAGVQGAALAGVQVADLAGGGIGGTGRARAAVSANGTSIRRPALRPSLCGFRRLHSDAKARHSQQNCC